MIKLLGISTLLTLLLFMLQTGVSSCSKDETIFKTDTVRLIQKDTIIRRDTIIKKDTIIIKDTPITIDLLTKNAWKIQELRGVAGNALQYYKRGGTGNTFNYDVEYVSFNANKTGIYFDANGASHPITWEFNNPENTKLTYIVSNPGTILAPFTIVVDNLRYKNGALYLDQYWSYNNVNSHEQIIRIPR